MKKLLNVLFLLLYSALTYGKQVGVEKAKLVATHFLKLNAASPLQAQRADMELTYVSTSSDPVISLRNQHPYFYIFNLSQAEGFVIVAADDLVYLY